jgi:hypothetical protein
MIFPGGFSGMAKPIATMNIKLIKKTNAPIKIIYPNLCSNYKDINIVSENV